MSWYQENKFAGTLLGITAVVSGALIYLGMSANSDASAAKQKEQAAVTKINALQKMKPFPNEENEKLLVEDLTSFAADTKAFQDKMLTFRPAEMPKIRANEFSGQVSGYVNKLNKYYSSKGVAFNDKEKPFYGMEAYADSMAKENHTVYLNYHRQALEWLFTTLADSGIDTLNHVYRAPVAEALGTVVKPVEAAKGKKKSKKKKNRKPAGLTSVSDNLPIEITFTGTEASLQKFLTDVAAGEDYFFAVKLLKIRNTEQDPVVISQATFAPVVEAVAEEAAPVDGLGGLDLDEGFDFTPGGGAGLEEDKEIIKQVIGDEKITAFIQLDLVLLKDAASVPIPRLKKDKPAKKSAKKPSTK